MGTAVVVTGVMAPAADGGTGFILRSTDHGPCGQGAGILEVIQNQTPRHPRCRRGEFHNTTINIRSEFIKVLTRAASTWHPWNFKFFAQCLEMGDQIFVKRRYAAAGPCTKFRHFSWFRQPR